MGDDSLPAAAGPRSLACAGGQDEAADKLEHQTRLLPAHFHWWSYPGQDTAAWSCLQTGSHWLLVNNNHYWSTTML